MTGQYSRVVYPIFAPLVVFDEIIVISINYVNSFYYFLMRLIFVKPKCEMRGKEVRFVSNKNTVIIYSTLRLRNVVICFVIYKFIKQKQSNNYGDKNGKPKSF